MGRSWSRNKNFDSAVSFRFSMHQFHVYKFFVSKVACNGCFFNFFMQIKVINKSNPRTKSDMIPWLNNFFMKLVNEKRKNQFFLRECLYFRTFFCFKILLSR